MAESDVCRKIQQLSSLTIAALRIKYREVFGREVKVLHKQFLIRRIAWQLQASVQGDLTARARLRISEIADGVALNGSSKATVHTRSKLAATRRVDAERDPRLPAVGSLLRRRYRGREIVVKILPDAFECDSKRYTSLSALARELTGTRWNGLLFFGLAERRHG